MCIAAFFIIAKRWKTTQEPIDSWMDKMSYITKCYTYTHIQPWNYSALKKEGNSDTSYNMGELWRYYTTLNKWVDEWLFVYKYKILMEQNLGMLSYNKEVLHWEYKNNLWVVVPKSGRGRHFSPKEGKMRRNHSARNGYRVKNYEELQLSEFCQDGTCLLSIEFSFVRSRSCGDWLYNNVNIFTTTELYT